ncbi:MAG: hypothetical protein RJB38_451 [Pseudomonadota bacterium]|jgi:hypothetical protein
MHQQLDFHVFVGIDQTGAVLPGSNGLRARPLPWAAVIVDRQSARLSTSSQGLERLHLDVIDTALRSQSRVEADEANIGIAVLVDAVLGLPRMSVLWSEALARLAPLPRRFGRQPAAAFFSSLLGGKELIPTRLCEQWARANSVFRELPYQKNIQTGTFRVWQDLISDPRREEWAIWPYSRQSQRYTLFEGYPSLMWRQLARQWVRDRSRLAGWLFEQKIEFTSEDESRFSASADLADAVMLAVSGWILHRRGILIEPFPGFFESATFSDRASVEGWIAGLQGPVAN